MTDTTDKYNHFAEFISDHINSGDLIRLSQEFSKDKYDDSPEKIINKMDEFFEKRWKKRADASPSRGNARTQKENFQKFVRASILTKKKVKYEDPFASPGREFDSRRPLKTEDGFVDFDPLFARYNEVTGKIAGKEVVSSKSRKLMTELFKNQEVNPYIKYKFDDLKREFQQTEKRLNTAVKNNNDTAINKEKDVLLKIRDAFDDRTFSQKYGKESWENLRKADDIIEKAQPLWIKTPKEQEEIYDVKQLPQKLSNRIEILGSRLSAARQGGNSRLMQKYANELIAFRNAMSKTAADYTGDTYVINKETGVERKIKSPLDAKTAYKNYNQINSILGEYKKSTLPKKKFIFPYVSLEEDTKKLKKLYKTAGKKINVDEKSMLRKYISKTYPFFSRPEVTKEVNRRLAANLVEDPNIMVPKVEYEKRFMDWKYGDTDRRPAKEDLINMANVKYKDFESNIRTRVNIDPITQKEVKVSIPRSVFKELRDSLFTETNRYQEIEFLAQAKKFKGDIEVAALTQEEEFLETAIQESMTRRKGKSKDGTLIPEAWTLGEF